MINSLSLGMFDFLEVLITPLWIIVILVFIAILVVLSITIIREAKKKQKGIKPYKKSSDYYREIEPYSEMPYIRITFEGDKKVFNESLEDNDELPIDDIKTIAKRPERILEAKKN